ncbi:MAG: selenocysteine-specific translation elongation factor [Fidelibacterota bacterium]
MAHPVLIGTAGHIDHGKSTLIRALTGTDPDRLIEEKERGMTIDIGFAFLNENIAFIDVPGHEKFIKNMVTGASTIGVGMLVIAADDGIMPQTREHFEILRLLNVREGIIVITKTDLVDSDWLELVEADIRDFVKSSFLENAQLFRVSAVKESGITELRDYLLTLPEKQIDESPETRLFRLPVDRVFSVKGYGTVVTGTVIGGRVQLGDKLDLQPRDVVVKVRGIQSHNRMLESISAGHRAAINIQGIDYRDIQRGAVLTTPGTFRNGRVLTVWLEMLPAVDPLKYNAVVRVHLGTGEYLARVRLIGQDRLLPGEEAIGQLLFEKPLCAGFRDRFVIRRYSPMQTIGGGIVLEPAARALRKKSIAAAESQRSLMEKEGAELIEFYLQDNFPEIFSEHDLAQRFSLSAEKVSSVIHELTVTNRLVAVDKFWTVSAPLETLKQKILRVLTDYHKRQPLLPGMLRPELREIQKIPVELLNYLLTTLAETGAIRLTGERVAAADFRIEFSAGQEQLIGKIEEALRAGGFEPPKVRQADFPGNYSEREFQQIIAYLVETQRIVQLERGMYIHIETLQEGGKRIKEYLRQHQLATVSELKEVLHTSRKWAVPVLNYFDRIGLTYRNGDQRGLNADCDIVF